MYILNIQRAVNFTQSRQCRPKTNASQDPCTASPKSIRLAEYFVKKKANYGRNRHGVVKVMMRFDKGTINT